MLLGLIFIALGFSIASEALEYYFDHPSYDAVAILFNSPLLFITILLYYASTVTQTWKSNWPKHQRFLIFVGVDIALMVLFFAFQVEPHPIAIALYYTVVSAINLYMLYLILKQIDLHNKHIRNLFSSIENKQLNWLRLLTVINMGFIFFWWIDDTLAALIGDNVLSEIISELSIYFTVINVIWMGYASLRQPLIFETEPEVFYTEKPPKEMVTPSSDDQATFKRIQKQIETQQLYTNPALSLKSLADILEIRDRELSRIINQCDEHNFYHFINAYRVAHFKEAFSNDKNQHLSIMGLATEAGFKSKSTFYAAFKKMEGITPKEFADKADA